MTGDEDLAALNPCSYRGYDYDEETGYYYLKSRYNNPVVYRFVNSDVYASTGLSVLGSNPFIYCNNKPINSISPSKWAYFKQEFKQMASLIEAFWMITKEGRNNMGIWGTSLFDQDTTCDVRDHYLQLLKNGCSNEEAYLLTLQEFAECMDSDEEPLFWYALADTQWSYGRLMPEVRQRALDWMEREDASSHYSFEPNDLRRWLREISRLRTKLNRKQPKEKVIEDPADYQFNPGKTGDVFAYRLHRAVAKKYSCHGKYVLMQKIGECFNGMDYLCPVFVFFNGIYDDLPTDFNPEESRLLPFDVPERFMPSGRNSDFPKLTMGAILDLYLKKNSPAKHIVPIGTYPVVHTGNQNNGEYGWDEIEDTFLGFYTDWQDYLYVMKEDCAIVLPKDASAR